MLSPTTAPLLQKAASQIRSSRRAVLACHHRPDGDALGSLLGLTLGLEQLGIDATALCADGVPPRYRFLPEWERVRAAAAGEWDLGVGLDTTGADRFGEVFGTLRSAPFLLALDHHVDHQPFADLTVIDTACAATGELALLLLDELGVALTPAIAQNLLAAILTDTGCFRFSNTSPQTFRLAARLREAGAAPGPIYEAVYGTRDYAASVLLGEMLAAARRDPSGRVVWGSLTHAQFRRVGAGTDASEGFVDQLRMVEGSAAAVFLREEANGEIRCSLRSGGEVDVAAVARRFGGGGHVPAAGCTLPAPLEEAERRLVAALCEAAAGG